MKLDSFIGSEDIKQSLLASIDAGRLAHGIIIFAEKGCGVNYFARLLACDILQRSEKESQAILENTSPLLQLIVGEGASGQIKVERIREISNNVNFSSLSGDKRIVIIENCENFNLSSANALLKNLEEPKGDITYILTCSDSSKLLATIRSRCGFYTLSTPTIEEAVSYFTQDSVPEGLLDVCKIYSGHIGLIKHALENENRYEILKKAVSAHSFILKRDSYALARLFSSFAKKREDIKLFIEDLEHLFKKELSPISINILNEITDLKRAIAQNANLLLVLENFVCRI